MRYRFESCVEYTNGGWKLKVHGGDTAYAKLVIMNVLLSVLVVVSVMVSVIIIVLVAVMILTLCHGDSLEDVYGLLENQFRCGLKIKKREREREREN